MTKLGFISDVHGDLSALLDAFKAFEAMKVDRVVCLGDLVDYAPLVDEVIFELRSRKIETITGNHCLWAKDRRYVAHDLSEDNIEWMDQLPKTWSATIKDVRVVAFHASPKKGSEHMEGIYVQHTDESTIERYLDLAEADVLLVGHTHDPMAIPMSKNRLVCNPGALLRDPDESYKKPTMLWNKLTQTFEDGEPAVRTPGTFGVLELPKKEFRVYEAKTGYEMEIPRRLGASTKISVLPKGGL